MLKRSLMVWMILMFFTVVLFAEPDFEKHHVTQSELSELIDNWHTLKKDSRLKRMMKLYPTAFQGLDISEAYYRDGMRYYRDAQRLTSLFFFLRGFAIFDDSPFKYKCAYQASKVLYQQRNRESALYYINRVLEHSEGNLKQEALRLKKRIRWEYFSRFEGLPDDSISDIEFDGDDVWISMWTGGVSRFSRSSGVVRIFRAHKNELISDHVRSIGVTQGRVWVGTYDGLCFYDKKYSRWSGRIDNIGRYPVKKLYQSGNHLYAAVLRRGIFRYESSQNHWTQIFRASPNVSSVAGNSKHLYVGTLDDGVYEIQASKVRHILPKLAVKALFFEDGRLWVGTYGQGLQVWSAKSRKVERTYTTAQGFVSDYVESLLFVAGKVLVGTLGGGVEVLSRTSFKPLKVLTVLDGLPSPDVVEMQAEGSRIWFGTLSGGVGILLTEDFTDI